MGFLIESFSTTSRDPEILALCLVTSVSSSSYRMTQPPPWETCTLCCLLISVGISSKEEMRSWWLLSQAFFFLFFVFVNFPSAFRHILRFFCILWRHRSKTINILCQLLNFAPWHSLINYQNRFSIRGF